MRIQFIVKPNGPERRVCEAEVIFEDGPMAGTKLVGFSLWRGADGEFYVTFPSRAFGASSERRFFEYVRPVESTEATRRLKEWILSEYHAAAAVNA